MNKTIYNDVRVDQALNDLETAVLQSKGDLDHVTLIENYEDLLEFTKFWEMSPEDICFSTKVNTEKLQNTLVLIYEHDATEFSGAVWNDTLGKFNELRELSSAKERIALSSLNDAISSVLNEKD